MSYVEQVSRAAEELRVAAAGVDPTALTGMVEELVGARRIVSGKVEETRFGRQMVHPDCRGELTFACR